MSEVIGLIQSMPVSKFGDKEKAFEDHQRSHQQVSTRLHRNHSVFHPDAEVLSLVHQVFLKKRESPLRTVVFSGLDHGAGCSRIAAGTAAMLAAQGESVCLLEANFISPSLAGLFGSINFPGLSEALTSEAPISKFAKQVDGDGRLWLVPAGNVEPESSTLLVGGRLYTKLQALQQDFTFVVVDAPPMKYAETLALGRIASGIVLVLEAERTRRDSTAAAANKLRASEINLLAAVLNKRTYPIPGRLYARL